MSKPNFIRAAQPIVPVNPLISEPTEYGAVAGPTRNYIRVARKNAPVFNMAVDESIEGTPYEVVHRKEPVILDMSKEPTLQSDDTELQPDPCTVVLVRRWIGAPGRA